MKRILFWLGLPLRFVLLSLMWVVVSLLGMEHNINPFVGAVQGLDEGMGDVY